jgi:hypothetical protein
MQVKNVCMLFRNIREFLSDWSALPDISNSSSFQQSESNATVDIAQ